MLSDEGNDSDDAIVARPRATPYLAGDSFDPAPAAAAAAVAAAPAAKRSRQRSASTSQRQPSSTATQQQKRQLNDEEFVDGLARDPGASSPPASSAGGPRAKRAPTRLRRVPDTAPSGDDRPSRQVVEEEEGEAPLVLSAADSLDRLLVSTTPVPEASQAPAAANTASNTAVSPSAGRKTKPKKATPRLSQQHTVVGWHDARAAAHEEKHRPALANGADGQRSAMADDGMHAAAAEAANDVSIIVNGVRCVLGGSRVAPDLLFGPHVLLMDADTGVLLLPNGIDGSVQVAPGRTYTTVRLRGGTADLVHAGFVEEDRRLVPRSWVFGATSAAYRAGAANFYADVPSLSEHMEQQRALADEALQQLVLPEKQPPQEEGNTDDDTEDKTRRRALRKQLKRQRKAAKHIRAALALLSMKRLEPPPSAAMGPAEAGGEGVATQNTSVAEDVATQPWTQQILLSHPAAQAERQAAAFAAVQAAVVDASVGRNPQLVDAERLLASQRHCTVGPGADARGDQTDATDVVRGWAMASAGRSRRTLTGYGLYIRENPGVSFATARAAFDALTDQERRRYRTVAKELNQELQRLAHQEDHVDHYEEEEDRTDAIPPPVAVPSRAAAPSADSMPAAKEAGQRRRRSIRRHSPSSVEQQRRPSQPSAERSSQHSASTPRRQRRDADLVAAVETEEEEVEEVVDTVAATQLQQHLHQIRSQASSIGAGLSQRGAAASAFATAAAGSGRMVSGMGSQRQTMLLSQDTGLPNLDGTYGSAAGGLMVGDAEDGDDQDWSW